MLNIAARNDKVELIHWLIDKGADINAVSEDRGYTAIMDAVWRGDKEITELLSEIKRCIYNLYKILDNYVRSIVDEDEKDSGNEYRTLRTAIE